MKVGDALAHARVRRDERTFGTKGLLHRDRGSSHRRKDGREEAVWQIVERFDVLYRHDKHVARQERRSIEEGDNVLVAKDDVRRELAISDLTEQTRRSHSLEGRPQHHESNDCQHDEVLDAADDDVAWIA